MFLIVLAVPAQNRLPFFPQGARSNDVTRCDDFEAREDATAGLLLQFAAGTPQHVALDGKRKYRNIRVHTVHVHEQ